MIGEKIVPSDVTFEDSLQLSTFHFDNFLSRSRTKMTPNSANSAIHKAAGSLVTGIPAAGTTSGGRSFIDGFMDGMVKWWNSTRQSREPLGRRLCE